MARSLGTTLLGCTVAVALLLVGAHVVALAMFPGSPPLSYSAAVATGVCLLSLLLYLSSAVLARRGWRHLPTLLLVAGSVGLFVSVCDLVIVGLKRDTSDWCGEWCLTHDLRFCRLEENKDGFWERDLDPFRARDDRDRVVIAVVGDSFTMGQGLSNRSERFTDRLEQLLRVREGLDVTVLNFGRRGMDTVLQGRFILPVVKGVRPDIVVLGYLSNDISGSTQRYRSLIESLPPPSLLWRILIRLSPSVSYLHCNVISPWLHESFEEELDSVLIAAYQDDQIFAAHRSTLRKLLGSCTEIGNDVLFVLLPFPSMWVDRREVRDQTYQKILRVVKEVGIRTADLSPIEDLHPVSWFTVSRVDAHPGPEAHEVIAEALLAPVAEMIRARQTLVSDRD